ncbi:MAG: cache domain-containing protein [Hoeflea sp.]|uniref:methyl-accepting chemotaxis protein n=1 Tax=Hoeflea sp. TaxID=1940281 RepID=UPI001D5357CA|nr:methyl-accepting chemotaxis protein [Hoeflea sp.]MBU4530144.1 cache domain-containing protein [Alphaproteobacteria bacterium]MBU4542571.1 cache domain-containing protein [Alphaproteobacteria bacterium]MBU4551252.1 cache domain-containing protein [Alphaproteobacteria bacterium]MBV1723075.1 cache domain-containing protein [Hoeflea sp.]MBV1760086.1 cache domain-containing protein [Hoeflea sp.]
MSNFKISTRLYLLVGIALAVFTAAAVYKLYDAHDSMVIERKAKLSGMNETIVTMLGHYQALEASGALTREEAQARAIEAVKPMRYEDSGYFWVNDMANFMIMHPINTKLDGTDLANIQDPTGKYLFREFIEVVKADGQGFVDYYWPKPGAEEPVLKYSHVQGFAPWGWIVGTGVYADDLAALFYKNAVNTAVTLGLGALVILLIAYATVRSVVVPIGRLNATMQDIAREDVCGEVPETDRKDEVGEMAASVLVLRDSVRERTEMRVREAEQQQHLDAERNEGQRRQQEISQTQSEVMSKLGAALESLASGDLTVQIDALSPEYAKLRDDFNNAVSALGSVISTIAHSTDVVSASADGISEAANNLSQRTEQQAASLEETAAALDEITSTVRHSSERATEANRMVGQTRQSTDKSGKIVTEAITAMTRIKDESDRIGKIIGVIDEIAFQTNLLALNAGVEAARAGEAGRGFAVVAQEVRELAQRSATAAREIKELISSSANEVQNGVSLVQSTGEALSEIEKFVTQVNEQVNSIATAAREQANALAEVNTAVNQMDQMTQQNAAMVEETSAASMTLTQESAQLNSMLRKFRLPQAGHAQQRRARAA